MGMARKPVPAGISKAPEALAIKTDFFLQFNKLILPIYICNIGRIDV
jgi:hypothetical protein